MFTNTPFTKIVTNTLVEHVVILREYERGYGSKNFLALSFKTRDEAIEYRNSRNAKNTDATAPDYYIRAFYYIDIPLEQFNAINK